MYFFLFFLNLTTQAGIYMAAPCGVDDTAAQCLAAPPLDAGAIGASDYPVVVKAVGPRTLPKNIEFGKVTIVLASNAATPNVATLTTFHDRHGGPDPHLTARAEPVRWPAGGCYEQSTDNGALSRPLAGDYDARALCLS